MTRKRFDNFESFYLFYLSEHQRYGTRVLHFVGTTLFIVLAAFAFVAARPFYFLGAVVAAYGCAWLGHFLVEHNRPATFQYPLYSLRADFRLYKELLTGRRSFKGSEA